MHSTLEEMSVGTLIVFSALASAISCFPTDQDWIAYKTEFGKQYNGGPLQDALRREIFRQRKQYVEKFNMNPNTSFKLGINQFTDSLESELVINRFNISKRIARQTNTPEASNFLRDLFSDQTAQVPDSFDWRDEANRVGPVRSRDFCDSGSAAFATTALLEGQMAKLNMSIFELSVQNILDCSKPDGEHGCRGLNYVSEQLKFIMDQGGLASEETYPCNVCAKEFVTDLPCRFTDKMIRLEGLKDLAFLPEGDEEKLKEALYKYGPIAINIADGGMDFMAYKSGIYYHEGCDTDFTRLYTSLLLVGYGSEKGQDYWIAKNSWSTDWGEDGYVRLTRNRGNHCGVATVPVLAIF